MTDLTKHTNNGASAGSEAELETIWRRPHLLTPLIEAWKAAAIFIILGAQPGLEMMEDLSESGGIGFIKSPVVIVLGVIGIAAILGVFFTWISWLFTSYALGTEAVHLKTGVLWRNRRQARLDRLQAVDVVQPFLARLVGLADIRIEVAGGQDSAVRIAYLKETDARALRNEILARSAGLDVEEDQAAPEAPENQVYEVPFGRLIGSLVLSGPVIGMAVAMGFMTTLAIITKEFAIVTANIPAVFMLVSLVWQNLNRGAFFRAGTSPDGIRITHGLLEQRRQTVPRGRVQVLEFKQPLLWRKCGWWRVEINVAGYGESNPGQALVNVLLPVGTRDDALAAMWLVINDMGIDNPHEVIDQAMVGFGTDGGFTTSPRRAFWVDPLVVKRTGYAVTPRALLIRRGRLSRRFMVVPHERTQSLEISQGPLQRVLRVAKFAVNSTPGPVSPEVPHLDEREVVLLLKEQNERSRQARAADRSERWMVANQNDAATIQDDAPAPTSEPREENAHQTEAEKPRTIDEDTP